MPLSPLDGFKLKLHSETRELPVFELRMARRDGKTGDHPRVGETDCKDVLRRASRIGQRSG
jgi:hypothetical protein